MNQSKVKLQNSDFANKVQRCKYFLEREWSYVKI